MKIHAFILGKIYGWMNKQMKKMRQLFFTGECQLTSMEGMKELENQHWQPPE